MIKLINSGSVPGGNQSSDFIMKNNLYSNNVNVSDREIVAETEADDTMLNENVSITGDITA